MVAEVATGDPTRLLCLNCARRTVSPTSTSKYSGLARHLKFRGSFTDTVKLGFAQIDGIIRDNLPMAAYREEGWWSNSAGNVHARGWLEAGWEVQEVNLKEGYVVFKKVKAAQPVRSKRGRRRSEGKKPFTPVPVRVQRSKVPSKTKVSRLYARVRNLERQKAAVPRLRGSFRPRPSHEKRLFKSKERQ